MCQGVLPFRQSVILECGGLTPLSFFPSFFICRRISKERSKESGVKSPHSKDPCKRTHDRRSGGAILRPSTSQLYRDLSIVGELVAQKCAGTNEIRIKITIKIKKWNLRTMRSKR